MWYVGSSTIIKVLCCGVIDSGEARGRIWEVSVLSSQLSLVSKTGYPKNKVY
jgi:hypothetical protein